MIVYLGDTHGAYSLRNAVREIIGRTIYGTEEVNIIQVGDAGRGFTIKDMEHLHNIQKDIKDIGNNRYNLYVVRGNHDNPYFFSKRFNVLDILPSGKQKVFLLKDYSKLLINDQKVGFIGGGVSIDRSRRVEGFEYWSDEVISRISKNKLRDWLSDIDILVTHVPDADVFNFNGLNKILYSLKKDVKTVKDLQNENEYTKTIKELLIERNSKCVWVSGHHHTFRKEKINGIEFYILKDYNVNYKEYDGWFMKNLFFKDGKSV